ncbi:MAG: DUF2786 domain-containing protein [Oligoflexia bacterium]|nr:DUF2786 domain-containing protein [Oligoflexia bacterium]
MFIYSQATSLFLSKIRSYIREILTQEMSISLSGNNYFHYKKVVRTYESDYQFYLWQILNSSNGVGGGDRQSTYTRNFTIPYSVVCFEDKERLGFFDSKHYQIGLNKVLMYNAKTTVIKNILRHELAHFMLYLSTDFETSDHGEDFKEICRRYKWDCKEIMSAYANVQIQNDDLQGDLESERIITKVKKLFALTQSSNQHEAELATIKANQLLIKYNLKGALDSFNNSEDKLKEEMEEFAYVERVLSATRTSAKMRAISDILDWFLVYPVFNHGNGVVHLEVTGSKVNVELASYVAKFLDYELSSIWERVQSENPKMKGIRHKNSFMVGIAQGYKLKMLKERKLYSESDEKALVVLEQNLSKKVKLVYGKLGSSRSGSTMLKDSLELGKEAGQGLNIRSGIESDRSSSSSNGVFLLE